jgi:hypothetical protein
MKTIDALSQELAEPGSPTNLPYELYCRYGVCQAHEPHMPWCTEFTADEIARALTEAGVKL